MDNITYDLVATLEEINNFEGPYREITTDHSSYNLKLKKTYIPNLIIINNKVCDFNKSEAYIFNNRIIILLLDKEIYYGEIA